MHKTHPRPAPAEVEVSEIVEAELDRLKRRFMFELGMSIDDAVDQVVAKQWIESQVPTEGFYDALRKLEMVFNINQIVSILSDVQTPGIVLLRTNIDSETQYTVSFAYRSIA